MSEKSKGKDNYILVFDAGTQSIRAALIDRSGDILEIVKTPIEPYFSKNPGWAEQDPELFWKTLADTSRKLLATANVDKDAIKGVTITSQRATVINLDREGKPLRPAIIWLDQRKADAVPFLNPILEKLLRVAKLYPTVEKAYRDCEANWIRQNQPEIWEKTGKFLLLSGFLAHRMTGEYNDSSGNMVGYVPFDFKKQEWAGKLDLKWKLFPMDREVLPDLVKPSGLLGYVTEKASEETGIPKGLPVIAAGTDKACEVLGAGCSSPEIGCLSFGTTATLNTATEKYVEFTPFVPPFPSAIPGLYNNEIMVYRGFWMVSWFKQEFGLREQLLAQERNISAESLFDELIEAIPPGSMGLTLQPYWSPGINTDSDAKGAIIGFGDVHTRAHIYRSILEGLGYALKEGMLLAQKKNKVPIRSLRVCGGGSQSNVAMQITADIFGLPAQRPHTYETSALGAAIDAAVGLKMYPDFDAAVKGMTRSGGVFEPIRANTDIYSELFERVYLKMYKNLRSIYNDIREITGYPEK